MQRMNKASPRWMQSLQARSLLVLASRVCSSTTILQSIVGEDLQAHLLGESRRDLQSHILLYRHQLNPEKITQN